ncbi:nuclear transport factor 2 family protein [Tersicoccus sp. MR15.9]|uniref:nuclear transport factor 2 family protein n=1 Tax=Tersicoccus mangrovi TaxID=3121635 RepID=UPI002FE59559
MTEQTTAPTWLVQAAQGLAAGDVEAWMAMYADDAVHEFPFAPEPRRLEGKTAIRRYMAAMGGSVRFGSLDHIRVDDRGEELLVEAEGHHTDAVTGEPFDLSYLWIITRRDGLVTRMRDYMSPRRPAHRES